MDFCLSQSHGNYEDEAGHRDDVRERDRYAAPRSRYQDKDDEVPDRDRNTTRIKHDEAKHHGDITRTKHQGKDDEAKHQSEVGDRERNTPRFRHQDKDDEARYSDEVSEKDRNITRFKHQGEDELKTRSSEDVRRNDQVVQVLLLSINC